MIWLILIVVFFHLDNFVICWWVCVLVVYVFLFICRKWTKLGSWMLTCWRVKKFLSLRRKSICFVVQCLCIEVGSSNLWTGRKPFCIDFSFLFGGFKLQWRRWLCLFVDSSQKRGKKKLWGTSLNWFVLDLGVWCISNINCVFSIFFAGSAEWRHWKIERAHSICANWEDGMKMEFLNLFGKCSKRGSWIFFLSF